MSVTKILYSAGYIIQYTTWENDLDNVSNHTINLKSKEETKILVEFLSMFQSTSNGGVGNIHDCGSQRDKLNSAIRDFCKKYPMFLSFDGEPLNDDNYHDSYTDFMYDNGLNSDDYASRVVEHIKVFYTPININVDVVTEEFVN